jgi:hypothetical protein
LGEVIEGMDNVENLYSYGDMPPWGNGPPQGKVHQPGYIEENFPKSDKFLHCKVERLSDDMDAKEADVVRKADRVTDEEEFAKAKDLEQKEEAQLRQRDLRPVENDIDQIHEEQLAMPNMPASEDEKWRLMGGLLILAVVGAIVIMLFGRKKKVDSKSN